MELDALHTALLGAIPALSTALVVLWRHGNNKSRSEELLQTQYDKLIEEKDRILSQWKDEKTASSAACDERVLKEALRAQAAIRARNELLALIAPIFMTERVNLTPEEQAEFQRVVLKESE